MTCGVIINRYLNSELPLQAYTNKFSKGLCSVYADATSDKLMSITEEMMGFLVTLDAKNVSLINNSYIFNRVSFNENGHNRKMKSFFKSALSPQKQNVSIDDEFKYFRAFVFRLRSDRSLIVPKRWKISDVDNIEWLNEIFDQSVGITDSFSPSSFN